MTTPRLLAGLLTAALLAAPLCGCGETVSPHPPETTAAPETTAEPLPPKMGENALDYLAAGFTHDRVTDPHTPLDRDSDLTRLEALYADLTVESGDMHHHTWYSDGYNTFAEVKASADQYRYDFFACSEHNNWKQLDEELYTEDRNLISMEYTTSKGHMNIYFPTREALQKVGDFTFHDPDRDRDYTMKFDKIPDVPVIDPRYWGQGLMQTYTKTLTKGSDFYRQLAEYVHSMGGFIYLCHPYGGGNNFTPLADENDSIEYFGFDGVEIFNAIQFNRPGQISGNVRAYEYWQSLLNEGYHVYASAGSDTHYLFEGETITHLNVAEKTSAGYYEAIASGNYSIANRIDGLRIRMAIGDTMMGGTTTYEAGKTLCIRIDMVKSYGPYRVYVYTDRGVAFTQVYNKDDVEIEIPIEDRLYYRVEIVKNGGSVVSTTNQKSYPYYLAFSQPIFLSAAD